MPDSENAPKGGVDVAFLSHAMEAFNNATVKLQSSYEALSEEARKLRDEVVEKNRELSYISNLLEGVLNNTRSAILVADADLKVFVRNRAGERLIEELEERGIREMLEASPKEGVFDYQTADDRYYRLSVGGLAPLREGGEEKENIIGSVFVIDEITTLKKFEQELRRGEQLQMMGEMVANIAHEIRNPLGSIELFAGLLERDLKDNGEAVRITTNIVKAVRTMNNVISNTLLFTKDLTVEKKEHILSSIVDDAVLFLAHKLHDKKVAIINKIDENLSVECDRALFYQVVMNLLHNAVEAVAEGSGQVELTSEKGDFVRLKVRDNGTGLPQEMRSKLFLPFQTTKAKGTGLGLSIAYKIAKAHGGDILVESDGASFTEFTVII